MRRAKARGGKESSLAKKKSKVSAEPETGAFEPGGWWPSEFAPFRFAIAHGVFLIALGIILLLGMETGSMVWMKRALAWLIGMENPGVISPFAPTYDIAI